MSVNYASIRELSKILEELTVKPFDDILNDVYIQIFFKTHRKVIYEVTKLLNNWSYYSEFMSGGKLDEYVNFELYPNFASVLQPHKTTGNGDCLWNMISLALCGNETLTRVLRLLTVTCMLIMKNNFIELLEKQYKATETEHSLALARINFEENLRIALDNKKWGNTYHLIALATVLGKSFYIYSLFKTQGKFRLEENTSKIELNKHFKKKRNSEIGHHLRYEAFKNDFFPKTNRFALYGFYCGRHYTALIPKENLKKNLFRPINTFFD